MSTPLSIVYILLWLAEMGLATVAAVVCAGAGVDAWARTATGTADKAANKTASLLVIGILLNTDLASFRVNLKAARLEIDTANGNRCPKVPEKEARCHGNVQNCSQRFM